MNWVIKPGGNLRGEITVPGDKSVTQRAYIFAAMANGTSRIIAPLRAEDTDNTLSAVRSLGPVIDDRVKEVDITGAGTKALTEPGDVIDLGNSGTGARLMAGLLAACPFLTILTGDDSLRRRPMARVAEPLRLMGAAIDGRADGTLLPLAIRGGSLKGISYISPVASAQVKSSVLIAALGAEGKTTFIEPALSRDHTERMLTAMGVHISTEEGTLVVEGGQIPKASTIKVPGDISAAAFFLVAGTVINESDIVIRNVGVNPTRTGIIQLLEAMGARISIMPQGDEGEPVADIRVQGTDSLRGISIPEDWIPAIIDELPLAAVLASAADGVTELRGAGELRVKESDRISTTVQMLNRAGVKVDELSDGFKIHGRTAIAGSVYHSHGDHRIAMSSAILSLMADEKSEVRNTACAATSFPDFIKLMNDLLPGSVSQN